MAVSAFDDPPRMKSDMRWGNTGFAAFFGVLVLMLVAFVVESPRARGEGPLLVTAMALVTAFGCGVWIYMTAVAIDSWRAHWRLQSQRENK